MPLFSPPSTFRPRRVTSYAPPMVWPSGVGQEEVTEPEIVMLREITAWQVVASVTVRVTAVVPAVVGVPLITPLLVFKLRPAGKAPLVIA